MPDHVVHEKVIDLGLGESEVAAVGNEHVVRLLGLDHPVHNFLQMVHLLLGIVILVALFKIDVIVIILVEREPLRPAIVALLLRHHDRENVLL